MDSPNKSDHPIPTSASQEFGGLLVLRDAAEHDVGTHIEEEGATAQFAAAVVIHADLDLFQLDVELQANLKADPVYQKAKDTIGDLLVQVRRLTREIRELKRRIGLAFVAAETALSDKKFGIGLAEQLSVDLAVSPSALYDARLFAIIDPGETSEISMHMENLAWDWVRELVRVVKTPEELKHFLCSCPDSDGGSRQDFQVAITAWYNRYHHIKDLELEEAAPDAKAHGAATKPTRGRRQRSRPTTVSRIRNCTRHSGSLPDEVNTLLTDLQASAPGVAGKISTNTNANGFSITVSGLQSAAELRDVCRSIADDLSGIFGEAS